MKIKCLMHYDTYNSNQNRAYHLAACTKAEYIFSCFERLGYDVEILSASNTKGFDNVSGIKRNITEHISLELIPAIGRGNKIRNVFSGLFFRVLFFVRLLWFLKSEDVVWVYHSTSFIVPITILKYLKKFKMILEIEELYGDVVNSKKLLNRELRFSKLADGYIFPTEMLNDKINICNKPYAISYGTYKEEPIVESSFGDKVCHVVYAGTLDRRMGSLVLVEAAKYLNEKYHIHILGGGTETEIENVKKEIKKVMKESTCKITYEGILKGEKYTDFLKKCHIGICPHEPTASFNETSFPSKILSYMSNGLKIVSIKIPVIEKSKIAEYICFYDKQDASVLAEAIQMVQFDDSYDGRKIVKELDTTFMKKLRELMK